MKAKFFSLLFSILNYGLRAKNFNRPKILIYTDSRGYNVTSKMGKTPFHSYVRKLAMKYNVTYCICTEKYTTIIDFLTYYKNRVGYDAVVLHCGVVDFSPRPLSNIRKVFDSKANGGVFDKIEAANSEYHQNASSEYLYNGEKTTTLYSKKYFKQEVLPLLGKIDNLIWINSNHFVEGWEGNFAKGRPKNIEQTVNDFDSICAENISNLINLKTWTDNQIKQYTIDNIHFTKAGFNEMYKLIDLEIKKMLS